MDVSVLWREDVGRASYEYPDADVIDPLLAPMVEDCCKDLVCGVYSKDVTLL